MKFPKKSIPMTLAVLAAAVFTTATALAKPAPKPELSAWMSQAADLGNEEYMACIKSHIKSPPAANIIANFEAALACQKDP